MKSKFKVLMQNRPNAYESVGGDTVQMENTAIYLKKLGVDVSISLKLEPNVKKYDLIHIFNIQRPEESLPQLVNAQKRNKKIVVSPIFWDTSEIQFEKWRNQWTKEQSKRIVKNTINVSTFLSKKMYQKKFGKKLKQNYLDQQEILKNANALLPNSNAEINQLIKYFALPEIDSKCFVIPNAVEKNLLKTKITGELVRKFKLRDFVLEVGRIEMNKNQLGLIRALKGKNIQLVFAGAIAENDYYQMCKKEANHHKNVFFLGFVPHHLLPELYAFAKVHALPSYRETPGLSSLEAGLFGCNIVSTSIGSAKEYFGDSASYCEPDDIYSIQVASMQAYNALKNEGLKNKILSHYTWEIAAQKTFAVYKELLEEQI